MNVTALMVVALTTVKLAASVGPKWTDVTAKSGPVNPVPVIVTVVPPVVGPVVGEIEDTVGMDDEVVTCCERSVPPAVTTLTPTSPGA